MSLDVKSLNQKLSEQSYVAGFVPTSADAEVFATLKTEPDTSLVHAHRWYRHIAAFTPKQRAAFPKSSQQVSVAATSEGESSSSAAVAASKSKKELRAEQSQKNAATQKKPAPKKEEKAIVEKKNNRGGLEYTREEDFGKWYEDLVKKSGLIEYYDISGCYILRPWAYSIWETIQQHLDKQFKSIGVENSYFPLFVSQKNLFAEAEHIDDFAPEVAWVTKSGQSVLEQPIAVRATSETIMYPIFSDWIHSHRDLPLRINQWCSVVRWEFKKPTPFLRSREFLWQEGHTCHANQDSADKEVLQILDFYRSVYEDLLAVPVVKGRKSDKEKFAGADYTTTVEGFIPGVGRGIQGATSHCLGKNFARIFNIHFEDDKGQKQEVIQNSWGLTTRTIGVAVMVHSDDKGLVLPPRIAPIQVVFVPIHKKGIDDSTVDAPAHELAKDLVARGIRVKVDDRAEYNPGWKYNHWELKGVPLRLEVGPQDVEQKQVVVVRRDTGAKQPVSYADGGDKFAERISVLLETVQKELFEAAKAKRDASIQQVFSWEEFVPTLNKRMLCLTPWCGTKASEELVKEKSSAESKQLCEEDGSSHSGAAKTLCIPFEQPPLPKDAKCFITGEPAKCWALWGRSY
eukprot:c23234_g1_i1.p1 GENE.c23234_g1_i1~~c23234_g1_i1.p1  ORF type:complete len:640 (+),score=180.87 c23234_g1_i1:42-1922(+)